MALIKYCEGCRFEGRSMSSYPCNACMFGSRHEAPVKLEDSKRCTTCKHEDLPGYMVPCMNCGTDHSGWESKEKKSCDNCRFRDKKLYEEPCVDCTNEDQWEPRIKDGKEAKVIFFDDTMPSAFECAKIGVRGTSSPYYARKNYRVEPSFFEKYNMRERQDRDMMDALRYCQGDVISTERIYNDMYFKPYITNVIFNDPATIVFWSDHTKTVVKCQDGDLFDAEKGLAMAISKKYFGNRGHYCEEFKKWLPEEETEPRVKVALPEEVIQEIVKRISTEEPETFVDGIIKE